VKLPKFNVVREAFCTCLPKYNLNTYLGRCGHGCIYCYAVKFPSFRGPARPRLNLKERIRAMAGNTKVRLPVMLSDCTDPYQPLERRCRVTRTCVEALADYGFPLLIVTKSDLVVRDVDVFRRTPTVVSMTITTPNEETASFIEPGAPPPWRRFKALERVAGEGIPTVLRIDPIIPTLNSDMETIEELVEKAGEIGVRQVTASTLKPVRGFFQKLRELNPSLYRRLREAYSDGEWRMGYKYLSREKRRTILSGVREVVLKNGMEFATCREGLPEMNTTICDGTSYCRNLLQRYC